MNRSRIAWTFGPCLVAALFLVLVSLLVPEGVDGDLTLLLEQGTLALALVLVVRATGRFEEAGWQRKAGFAWIWLAGPLWLAILTPIGLSAANVATSPARALLWLGAALVVGISEETLFRGFLLSGLRRWLGPLAAATASSLLFGALHVINALWGADSEFLMAQIAAAFGSGLLLSAVTLRAGSVWPAVFLHFAGDAVGLSAVGGYDAAIQSQEAAAGMLVFGALCGVWGAFWIWLLGRRGRLEA